MTDPDTSAEAAPGMPARVRLDPDHHGWWEQVIGWADGNAVMDMGGWPVYYHYAEYDALAARLAAAEAELRQRHGYTYTVNPAAEWQARAEAAEAEVARLREALEALRFEVLCIKRNRTGTLGMALDRADAALAQKGGG